MNSQDDSSKGLRYFDSGINLTGVLGDSLTLIGLGLFLVAGTICIMLLTAVMAAWNLLSRAGSAVVFYGLYFIAMTHKHDYHPKH